MLFPSLFASIAFIAVAFTPLPDDDWLEPSILNEVEHALSRAYAATNTPPSFPDLSAPTNNPSFSPPHSSFSANIPHPSSPTNNYSFLIPHSSFSTDNSSFLIPHSSFFSSSSLAIHLVSTQRQDGRWYDGTNDVTAVAIAILEKLRDQ